jgi:hypothetical protein
MPSQQELENAAAWDIEQMLNQQGRGQVPAWFCPFPWAAK